MKAWRITTPGQVSLDGEESKAKGGRWHRAGRPLVYAATSGALATLEFLAHRNGDTPPDLVAMAIDIPDGIRTDQLSTDALPDDWRTPNHPECCAIGEQWLSGPAEARGAVLRVPSAVVPFEENLLIDPAHPDAREIVVAAVEEYRLDQRVL
ncbi:MAG: RES family NAD+ phosphorylase [Gemmatimonadota bacterium]